MTDGISALCNGLRAVGIECVFGVPGTQNVELFEGFRRHRLRTVLASHELAAAFMANGYYRATGRIAALATIPGPGFTYALTGIAEARLDSVGLLHLVGKPAVTPGRRFHLQAIDQRAIAAPLVKGCFKLDRPGDVAMVLAHAHALAVGGEPGPVMIELDLDALSAESPAVPSVVPRRVAARDDGLPRLAAIFGQAQRPVLLLGQGALGSAARLQRLAERLTIPVLTTPSARGIIPETHPLALGFDPLRGRTAEVNRFLDGADLILGLGCKLGHNGSDGFELRLPPDRFVHVDADPEVPGANYEALLCVTARVEDTLGALEVRDAPACWASEEVTAVRALLRLEPAGRIEPLIHGHKTTTPAEFFAWLQGVLPSDAIVITDSGLHQILTRRYFDVRSPRGLVCPSDFQSMGYGLPAAIGAKLGAPDRVVVAIIGDGGFMMSGLELLTARREHLPMVVFVFNDGQLNQIRLQQWKEFGHAHAVRVENPDFELLAEALGIGYLRLEDDPPGAVERALNGALPVLIEVRVGDSLAMRRTAAAARTKGMVRAAIPATWREWVKARLRSPAAR